MAHIELSQAALHGLSLLGGLAGNVAAELISLSFDVLLKEKLENAIEESTVLINSVKDTAVTKQAYYGIVTLILEAAKHDCRFSDLTYIFEDAEVETSVVKVFGNLYSTRKPRLRALLGSTGYGNPHIVDIDWRLDYYIKNNQIDRVDQPVYLINLVTETYAGGPRSDVKFSCTMEQLQDMLNNFKELSKQIQNSAIA